MATFSEDLFPLEVSAWAIGGRGFKTTVVTTYGGDEYRNSAWTFALGDRDVSEALRNTNPLATYAVKALRKFIMAPKGQAKGFRFRDPQDCTDEGGGILTLVSGSIYQAYKRYSLTSYSYDQIIQKLVSGTVATPGATGTWDYNTGLFTKTSGTAATWTGTFDIPVRMADDFPHIGLEAATGAMYAWQQLKLHEIREIS